MKLRSLIIAVAALSFASTGAFATTRPTTFDFEYSFPIIPPTSPRVDIPDYDVRAYVINVVNPPTAPVAYLEFEFYSLSHNSPMDLHVTLIDPVGDGVLIMNDAGWQYPLTLETLIFNDKFPDALPHGEKQGAIAGGFYRPDGPGSFSRWYGAPLREGQWRVIITDDAVGDAGSFEAITIRGTVVPEPATLTLLALGAIAALRRRRSQ
jgi:hypothetical protein